MKERKKLSRLKNLLEEDGGYDFTVFETHAESAVVRKKAVDILRDFMKL